jgi:hypothetical protein
VAQKRTFKVLSVRTVDEEVCAACSLYETAQLYAALPHVVVAGVGLWSPVGLEGRPCPDTFGILDIDFGEFIFPDIR